MNKKTVIIHGGFHKTASSTIQHSLGDNRSELKSQGFSYPFFSVDGKEFFNRSIPISGLYMSNPERFRQYWYHNQVDPVEVNGKQLDVLKTCLDANSDLIVSDEFISNLSENELHKLKEDIASKGFGIRFISYVREPLSLIVSSTQQMARTGVGVKSKDFKRLKGSEKIKTVFGEAAEFYSFEKACNHKDGPAGFFFDLIGFSYQSESIVRINEGISAQAVNLLSYINQLQPLFMGDAINPIRRRFDIEVLLQMPGDKYTFTEQMLRNFKPQVEEARADICKLLGEGFLPNVTSKVVDEFIWDEKQLSFLDEVKSQLDLNILLKIGEYLNSLELDKSSTKMREDFILYVAGRVSSELNSHGVGLKTRILSLLKYVVYRLRKSGS